LVPQTHSRVPEAGSDLLDQRADGRVLAPYYEHSGVTLYLGDALDVLRRLPDESVHCCITSPPYFGLRDYGTAEWMGGLPDCDHVYNHGTQGTSGQRADRTFTAQAVYKDECRKCGAQRVDRQLGLERTYPEYIERLVGIFREVRRVLRNDGTLWLNLGDTFCNSDKWGGGGANTGKHTRSADGSVPSWTAVRRKWAGAPGIKPKDLLGIPWRAALALQEDGWWLRSEIIWHKPNPLPESVLDRPTKTHEQIFLLAKSERYFYDADAIKEQASDDTHARYARGRSDTHKWADGGPGSQTIATNKPGSKFARPSGVNPKCAEPGSGIRQNESFSAAVKDVVEYRNKRSVWVVPTYPFPEAHFATYPPALILPCVLAGCPVGGTILDPFSGAATTALVSKQNGRRCIGIELNERYLTMSIKRLRQDVLFGTETDCTPTDEVALSQLQGRSRLSEGLLGKTLEIKS